MYSEARKIVADGVIPAEVVYELPPVPCPRCAAFTPPQGTWVAVCGTDVVRTNEGFHVLEDNLRVPSGVSYMIANRKATKASLRRLYRESRVQEVEQYGPPPPARPFARARPRRKGPDPLHRPAHPRRGYNSAFYEHMFLSHEIGAEPWSRDATSWCNDGFVYMRTTDRIAARRCDLSARRRRFH